MPAISKGVMFDYSICDALEKACIPFIPLKGSVLRDLYPEGWMRTSSDIDILVKQDDVEKAADILVEKLGYSRKVGTTREISFFSPLQIHLELHFDLIEDTVSKEQNDILSKIWNVAVSYLPGGQVVPSGVYKGC